MYEAAQDVASSHAQDVGKQSGGIPLRPVPECRDFLAWCHDGRRLPELFLPLIPALHHDAAGRIHGRGFAIKPEPGFTVDDKVLELEAAAASGGSSLET